MIVVAENRGASALLVLRVTVLCALFVVSFGSLAKADTTKCSLSGQWTGTFTGDTGLETISASFNQPKGGSSISGSITVFGRTFSGVTGTNALGAITIDRVTNDDGVQTDTVSAVGAFAGGCYSISGLFTSVTVDDKTGKTTQGSGRFNIDRNVSPAAKITGSNGGEVSDQAKINLAPTKVGTFLPHYLPQPYNVSCVDLFTQQALQDCQITVKLQATQPSGGHQHSDSRRPPGEIACTDATPDGCVGQTVADLSAGGNNVDKGLQDITVTTDSDGNPISLLYLPPPVGGDVIATISIQITGVNGSFPTTTLNLHITAAYSGSCCIDFFSMLPGTEAGGRPYYKLTGGKPGIHPDGHFGTRLFNATLDDIALQWKTVNKNNLVLPINDMSLIDGGLFDIGANWSTSGGHAQHRWGIEADIGSGDGGFPNSVPVEQRSALIEILFSHYYLPIRERQNGKICIPLATDPDCNHYHIVPVVISSN
jgi:hypothetical protein